ncbi:MAG: polyprenyl synthetase family protein [Candidatus Omnitrophota bacterium]
MIKALKNDIDAGLRSFLKEIKPDFGLSRESAVIYEGIRDFAERDGKRIRPILFILSYKGYTRRGKVSDKGLLRSSLSLELLHDFLLAHDDVIDKSELRRGKPTLHHFFNSRFAMPVHNELGCNLSIVAGDIIFALAVRAFLSLSEAPARQRKALLNFTSSAASTGIGEFIDVVNNIKSIDKISEKDVLLTYTMKTARYTFEGPLVTGALLAGAPEKEIKKLSELGLSLGLAFQIQDDLLDVFSSSERIGKPVLSDLSESKKTLLIWYTYKNLGSAERKIFKTLLEKKKKSHADLMKMKKMIIKSGAGKYCLKKTFTILKKSYSLCSSLGIKDKYRDILEHFIGQFFTKAEALKDCIG